MKTRQTYLKLGTPANLKMLNKNFKFIFKDFISKY